MTKGRKVLIVILALLIAVLAVLYFAVVRPLINETVEKEPVETEAGEAVGSSDRIFLFPKLSRDDISSIAVENSHGGYTFRRDETDSFCIDQYESMSYKEDLLASLIDTCANTLSKVKVMSSAPDERLSEYGLDNPTAKWTVTERSGKQHTVLVGKTLLTGGGYYCMYEGRRSVYVLSSDVGETVLAPVENLLTPYIMAGVSKDDYYTITDFRVYKNMELMMKIDRVAKEDQKSAESLAEHIVSYPGQYSPDTELFYNILMGFAALQGESIADATPDGAGNAWSLYGLDKPDTAVSFKYNKKTYEIYFSEKHESNEGDYYYASSNMFPTLVVKCSADDFAYVDYGLMNWISTYFLQTYITSVDSMHVVAGDTDVTFGLTHGRDEKNNATLKVETSDGHVISDADGVLNFRQYYKALLSFQVIDYLPMTEDQIDALITDESKRSLMLEFNLTNGKTLKYEFFPYSTRRSAVSINGSAEFYVYSDLVEKVISDTGKAITGEPIEAWGKN